MGKILWNLHRRETIKKHGIKEKRSHILANKDLIISFWGKVTDMNNFEYTYLLKYLHVGRISFVSEINTCNQIFGTITSLSQTLEKLKKKFSHKHPL